MWRVLAFCLCSACCCGVAFSQAAPGTPAAPAAAPASPYSATVPVAGTSNEQRTSAIAAALAAVLQQVSPGFTASPDALANASAYVRRYRYQRAPSGTGLVLTVDFDPGAVGRLVSGAGGGAAPTVASGASGGAAPAAAASTGAAAVAAGGGGPATIWVGGITDSHAFAEVLAALRGDSGLGPVQPVGADGDGVMVSVNPSQPLASALQSLTGPAGHLAPAAQPHAGADASLQWMP